MYTHIVARTRLICPLLLKEGKTHVLYLHTQFLGKRTQNTVDVNFVSECLLFPLSQTHIRKPSGQVNCIRPP